MIGKFKYSTRSIILYTKGYSNMKKMCATHLLMNMSVFPLFAGDSVVSNAPDKASESTTTSNMSLEERVKQIREKGARLLGIMQSRPR